MPATLTASLEDYLEAICHIIRQKEGVRPKDIAGRLGVAGASVTGALRALAGKGLINYSPRDIITLTAKGWATARDIIRRHETLRDFLVRFLSVGPAEADQAACQMEHSIPPGILERFIQFARFMAACPRTGPEWEAWLAGPARRGEKARPCATCHATRPKKERPA